MTASGRKLLILGGGSGIERYKEDIQRLNNDKNVDILTYGLSFMYCVNELGFQPDYHCFVDPVPFLPVYDYIERNIYVTDIKTKFVLLDPLHTQCSYQDFQNFYGTTPLGRGICPWPRRTSGHMDPATAWQWFLDAINNVAEHPRLNNITIPCTSIKHIDNNPDLYPEFENFDLTDKDFYLRFQGDKMIMKSQRNPMVNEDKLTGVVLPITQWLFKDSPLIKEIGIIGFELKGGRYMWNFDRRFINFFQERGHSGICDGIPAFAFNYDNNLGLGEALDTTKTYMKLWDEHTNLTKLDLHSVVEPEYSLLNNYIKYKSIGDFETND